MPIELEQCCWPFIVAATEFCQQLGEIPKTGSDFLHLAGATAVVAITPAALRHADAILLWFPDGYRQYHEIQMEPSDHPQEIETVK